MTRIALIRAPDELRAAIVEHEIVEVDAEVQIIALVPGDPGIERSSVPTVVSIARHRNYEEADRSSVESDADAYVLGSHRVLAAITWVASEDRALRTRGQPRLTVVGSVGEDFGMSRPLAAEPMIIGRSSSFSGSEHPQRRDRMRTPTGTIARHHAKVRCIDGVVSVRDLASTNGTLVIRHGEPARLLCPQEQRLPSVNTFGPPASPWITRDPSADWCELRIGDQLQMHGFYRFRVDGDLAWD